MYKQKAIDYYTGHPKFDKAFAEGTALDNSLTKDYGKEGSTDCRFMIENFLKYFDYESLKKNGVIPK